MNNIFTNKIIFDSKSISLKEEYRLDVYVQDEVSSTENNDMIYFTGKLHLSPEGITINAFGEEYNSRKCNFSNEKSIERLRCIDSKEKVLFLFHTKLISKRTHGLGFTIFEAVFTVEYVMYCHDINGGAYREYELSQISMMRIKSESIAKWIGMTKKQQNIIGKLITSSRISNEEQIEFKVDILNFIFMVTYDRHTATLSNKEEFSYISHMTPYIKFYFRKKTDIYLFLTKIINLFSFLFGKAMIPDEILLQSNNTKISLYYPSCNKYRKQDVILFPLGVNLTQIAQNELPALPCKDIFEKYFSLNEIKMELINNYIQYRYMPNHEGKYLEYFKIVETLLFEKKEIVDSEKLHEVLEKSKSYLYKKFNCKNSKDKKNLNNFIKSIYKLNQKYNIAKCIQDFLNILPNIEIWRFKGDSIKDICQLRNDIAHGNTFRINKEELWRSICFLDVLIIFLLSREIGMPISFVEKFIKRSGSYKYIVKEEYYSEYSFY